jgi:hypothetical protein
MSTVNIDKTVTVPPKIMTAEEYRKNVKTTSPADILKIFGKLIVFLAKAGRTLTVRFAIASCDACWLLFALVLYPLNDDLLLNYKKYDLWKRGMMTSFLYLGGAIILATSAYTFFMIVQFRMERGDWSATKKYERAKAASIKYSNKFMNYNQDIQDQYTNDKDKPSGLVHERLPRGHPRTDRRSPSELLSSHG